MQIGKLDQRVTLQSLAETNTSGGLTQAYTTVATVAGHVISQRGTEAFEAARVNARETIRVLLRYRTDLTAKWRIQWAGQTYNVLHVDRSQRRDGMLWLTAEVVGAS
jgi:SPP1 family predicted phage head-tail adaptor